MASEGLKQIIAMFREQKVPDEPLTVTEMRQNFDKMSDFFGIEKGTKRLPVTCDDVPGEWVVAPGSKDNHVILYLHGGGYVIGSPYTHRSMLSKIAAESEACVLALDYRMGPENPFPAAVVDAITAYSWLLNHGWESRHIAISGDSAGGGLTAATLIALKERGLPQPACAVLISPWADLTGTSETFKTRADKDPMVRKENLLYLATMYLQETGDAKDPLASPIFGDLSGIAPLYIMVGDHEALLGDSLKLHDLALAAGVDSELEIWDEMIHVWPVFQKTVPEGAEAIRKMCRYIQQRWMD